MAYIIVRKKRAVVGKPFATFDAAFTHANHLFGDAIEGWLEMNLRIEEKR